MTATALRPCVVRLGLLSAYHEAVIELDAARFHLHALGEDGDPQIREAAKAAVDIAKAACEAARRALHEHRCRVCCVAAA